MPGDRGDLPPDRSRDVLRRPRDGRALPERPVLVTFDDGYRSVFELARPILQRYQHSGRGVRLLRAGPPSASVLVRRRGARARPRTPSTRLRALPDEVWRSRRPRARHARCSAAPELAPMTEAQVRQLADEGFAIGVHTATHAPLAQASADVQRDELSVVPVGARIVDRAADPDAWPIRSARPRADYSEETIAIAAGLGFTDGFTTRNDFARATEPALERSRFVVLAGGHCGGARASHRLRVATLSRHRPSMSPHPGSACCSRHTTASDYIAESIESVLAQTLRRLRADHLRRSVDATERSTSSATTRDAIRASGSRSTSATSADYGTGVTPRASRRGRFLKYHDSDDVMYPHCLATMVEPLDAEPRAAFALSGAGQLAGRPVPDAADAAPRLRARVSRLRTVSPRPGVRRCFERMRSATLGGFPDVGVASDYLFWLKACATVNVLLVPGNLFYYRIHAGQEMAEPRAP